LGFLDEGGVIEGMGAVVVEDAEGGPCEAAVGAAFGDDVVFCLVVGAAAAFGDRRKTPGMEATGMRSSAPSWTIRGQTRSDGVRVVSATRRRIQGWLRRRRGRAMGKAAGAKGRVMGKGVSSFSHWEKVAREARRMRVGSCP
jgi:hypothetical protein